MPLSGTGLGCINIDNYFFKSRPKCLIFKHLHSLVRQAFSLFSNLNDKRRNDNRSLSAVLYAACINTCLVFAGSGESGQPSSVRWSSAQNAGPIPAFRQNKYS